MVPTQSLAYPKGKYLYFKLYFNGQVKSENICLKFQFIVLYSQRRSGFSNKGKTSRPHSRRSRSRAAGRRARSPCMANVDPPPRRFSGSSGPTNTTNNRRRRKLGVKGTLVYKCRKCLIDCSHNRQP